MTTAPVYRGEHDNAAGRIYCKIDCYSLLKILINSLERCFSSIFQYTKELKNFQYTVYKKNKEFQNRRKITMRIGDRLICMTVMEEKFVIRIYTWLI